MTGLTKPAFDLDQFVADCRHALSEDMPQKAVCEVMARALADAASVRDTMAVPRAEIRKLYAGPDLVVLNAIWAPGMSVPPHNHNMWAVIGLYDGREDNIFWRRISDAPGGRIEAAGAKSLSTGECTTLGSDIIHSVINPSARLSGALHVYAGDFVNVARSQWDADTLLEGPFNAEMATRVFEEASRRATG